MGQELLSTMQHAPTLDALIGILVSFLQAQATAGYGSAPLTWFVGEAPPHGAARIAGPGELQLSMPQAAQPAADRPINAVRLARGTLLQRAGSSPDRAVIEIIAGLMDYIFDEPCLSDAVKALFARLQIPLLKAALADHSVFSHARHPARRFIDTLGRALIGLRAGDAQSDAMIGLAHALVDKITNDFEDDLDVFSAAKHELDAHLDLEHALLNERLADAIPPLMWKEARTLARDRVQEQVSLQLTGRRVPIVVHRVLTHEWLDYLTDRYIDYGSESIEWTQELGLIDDLLWSLGPAAAQDQQRLRRLVPKLVKAFSGGAAMDAIAEPWRRVVLDTMFACHIGSIRQPRGTTAAGMPSELPVAPSMAAEPEAVDGQVHALARGDWCEFRADPVTKPVLARLAWRSPHRTQLLFTHRDGTTAFVHSPVSLSVEFAAGRTVVAVEDVPLCERAMRQLVAAHAQPQAH